MTDTSQRPPTPPAAVDPDVKPESEVASLSEHARSYWHRIRSGDLGGTPIIVGLLLLMVIFAYLNPAFLSPRNFTNLIVQMSPLVIVATGIVFVLLIAEVDLSVGYLSGVAAAILARLLTENGWNVFAAIALVVFTGACIGFLQGWLVAKLGLPSLIVTLAGLVGWNGVVLILLAGRGTVTIQNQFVISLTNRFLSPAVGYGAILLFALGYAAVQLSRRATRAKAGLPIVPLSVVIMRGVAVTALGLAAVFYANQGRGLPMVALIILVVVAFFTFVLQRTTFGRHVLAVGGNPEAARRAGINVDRIRIACFMISATMAAIGGILFAARLRSVDTSAGGGQIELNAIAAAVIGGTSLFGGRGKVTSALTGALVITGVSNGMGLLGLSSGAKFTVTAVVLLVAVLVDSVARRGRTRSGLA